MSTEELDLFAPPLETPIPAAQVAPAARYVLVRAYTRHHSEIAVDGALAGDHYVIHNSRLEEFGL